METRRIRPLALGVVWRGEQLLVQHGFDEEAGAPFFRPPGGAIEFGERAADAVRREFMEEMQAEIQDVQFLAVLENPFTYKGDEFHEIVFVFEVRFADERLYRRESFTLRETSTQAFASWKALDDLGGDAAPLYPTGLLPLLQGRRAGAAV